MNLLVAIALVSAAAAADTGVNVDVALEPPIVPFHRQAQYKITVEAPADMQVQLPDMIDKFGGLTSSGVKRKTEKIGGGRQRIIETYVLDPIRAAEYRIYPAEVKYGDNESVAVPSPALRVRDLTEEEQAQVTQLVDIGDPLTPPVPIVTNWKYVAASAIAAVAALVAAIIIRRRRLREKSAPPVPPWETAYQRLRELDERRLPQEGKYESYYVDLSAILRYYIEDRFSVHAPEQTTPEFLQTAAGSGIFTHTQQQLLAAFLKHCDYVKFARYVPNAEEMEQSFATVLQFIDETVPKPEPPKEQANEENAA
jgi:hypothetical protein